jgi:hypothetical protein
MKEKEKGKLSKAVFDDPFILILKPPSASRTEFGGGSRFDPFMLTLCP